MNHHQDMEKEQMRMAILKQEQIFRQQVHELHRLYHVEMQLMQQQQQQQQAQTTAAANRAPVIVDAKPRPQQLDIWCGEKATTTPQKIISFSSSKATIPAPALADDCNLELTLATGPSSSSSNSNNSSAERQQGKRLKASSNSDSGATAVSSTSTDSELAQFREADVTTAVRFQSESRRMDEMRQGPWMYQCLSLKTA